MRVDQLILIWNEKFRELFEQHVLRLRGIGKKEGGWYYPQVKETLVDQKLITKKSKTHGSVFS